MCGDGFRSEWADPDSRGARYPVPTGDGGATQLPQQSRRNNRLGADRRPENWGLELAERDRLTLDSRLLTFDL